MMLLAPLLVLHNLLGKAVNDLVRGDEEVRALSLCHEFLPAAHNNEFKTVTAVEVMGMLIACDHGNLVYCGPEFFQVSYLFTNVLLEVGRRIVDVLQGHFYIHEGLLSACGH